MTPVTIPLSKGKLLKSFGIACLFVVMGIWLWGKAPSYSGFKQAKAWFGAITCVVFFGAGTVVLGYKLFDQRPGLVLNDEGVHRLGLFQFQRAIPWKHITHCSITKVKRVTILRIHVDNVEEILAHLAPLSRWLQRMAIAQYGTPYSVSGANLKIDTEQLKLLIENGAAAHRQAS